MLLGKRPRPPMKRTTSLSEITLDLNTSSTDDVVDQGNNNPFNCQRPVSIVGGFNNNNNNNNNYNNSSSIGVVVEDQIQSRGVLATVSPRIQRRHSGDFLETPEFLRACSLCKRRLVPGRDIYMYRGDSAFCSLECRQQQMNQDERKDKFFVASKKQVVAPPSSTASQPTTKAETVSASS